MGLLFLSSVVMNNDTTDTHEYDCTSDTVTVTMGMLLIHVRTILIHVTRAELMDCNTGCDGGCPFTVYYNLKTIPAVSDWCDPYTQRKDVCGATCSDGAHFKVLDGTVQVGP